MNVEKGLYCAMSSAKQRFMAELSDQERKFIMDGIANGTLISTAHGSIDETLAIKRSIDSHGGDKQWAAKEWMQKYGYGVSRRWLSFNCNKNQTGDNLCHTIMY